MFADQVRDLRWSLSLAFTALREDRPVSAAEVLREVAKEAASLARQLDPAGCTA